MWAIVPIKTFDRAKQRLANVLSEEERRSLMLAMARDVLTCLTRSTQLSGILIVSRAPEADALAQSFGTERYAESPDTTLAQALEQAAQHLIAHFNATGIIVVPADVPGIEIDELDRLLAEHEQVTVLDLCLAGFDLEIGPVPQCAGDDIAHRMLLGFLVGQQA